MWPPDQPRLFKSLTFLHHDSRFKQKQLSHIAARYRHAKEHNQTNFDLKKNFPLFRELEQVHLTCCKSNATKNIADLFLNEDSFNLKSILVEGAPGIGKTELIKEIAYLWAKNEVINNMKIVFVLYLRDPNIHKLKSVEMFIHEYVNNKKSYLDEEQAKNVIQELRNSRGSNIAFLMDGFDEFPSKVYEDSFVADLINGEALPNAVLLITSRPNVSLFLHNQVMKVFDIVGFAKEEQEKYILDSLNSEQQNDLHQYLKKYPIINSYCYTPLHLAIVIFLLEHGSLPKTLTRINELFILHTIYRNLQQHNKQYKKLSLNKLADLPSLVFSIVHQLSKLAYDGVQNSKLVFSLEEIRQACPQVDSTPGAINGFGLLQAVEHYNPLTALEKTASFNFLHYSMQEYLAAFYVSTCSNKEQYSIMSSIKPMTCVLSSAKCLTVNVHCFWHFQFVFMWLMYMGITGQSWAFTFFLIKSGFFVDEQSAKYHKTPCTLNVVQILHLFQCFVEADDDRVCNIMFERILFKDGKVCIKGELNNNMTLFSHHMLSLVFFLTKSPKQYKCLEFINCCILGDAMSILDEYFLTYPQKVINIRDVRLENVYFDSTSGKFDTIIKTVSHISIVNLGNCDMRNMIKLLVNNQGLSSLELCRMIKDDVVDSLIQQLLNNKTLVSLNLAENFCGCACAKSIANFITVNTKLQILNISTNIIGLLKEVRQLPVFSADVFVNYRNNTGVVAIASALKKNSSLLSLNMSYNCIALVLEFAFSLYHNTVLKSLDLSNNFLDLDNSSSFSIFGIALRFNKALNSLNISKNAIGDTKMYHVIASLYYNRTLQSLDISGNGLTSSLVEDLSHSLRYNNYISLLALGSNYIGDEGVIHLSSTLRVNKTITSLYLRDNMITNVGAKAIAAALKKNTVLRKLDLSMNDISDKGASDLCNAFYIKNTLKTLFIGFNPISFAKIEEMFTKLATEDTIHYGRFDASMTNTSVTKVPVNRQRNMEATCMASLNVLICYVLTSNNRIIAFTYGTDCCYTWKNCLCHDICLQQMYAHISAYYPNDTLQKECLESYTRTIFNQLYTTN